MSSKRSVFLIHWNAEEAKSLADELRLEGVEVSIEAEDGARACRSIRQAAPDLVVIMLSRLPSHGRATAEGLRKSKATRSIPIVFIDGNETAVAATRTAFPEASFHPGFDLSALLASIRPSSLTTPL